MKSAQPIYYYPDRMGRVILLAMEEILGRSEMEAILGLAGLPEYMHPVSPCDRGSQFPFEHVSSIQNALESAYGARSGRGLALRIGRVSFTYGMREFGAELGLTDLTFRLLPMPAKLKGGSEAFAGLFNRFTDQRVRLERTDDLIYWHIERCPLCWQRRTEAACCQLAVGLLQEAFYWVSGGKYFQIEETKCVALGDSACTIVIDLEAMS